MYKKNKKVNRIFLICSAVLCLLLSSVFIRNNFNLPKFFVKDGMMFVNKAVTRFFGSKDYDRLLSENEQLKSDLELYKNDYYRNIELEKEINKLKEVTDINNLLSDSVYINGTVINRNFDFWSKKLVIDKGSNSSIDNNMAVISNGSLIGITDDVSYTNSSVMLLCNHDFPVNISVKIDVDGTDVYGILNNYNESTGFFEIVGVVDNIKIPEGSLVVTTGFGNIFPSGIMIGYVSSVTTDNFDLAKLINVRTDVNFDDISYVTVVKRDIK